MFWNGNTAIDGLSGKASAGAVGWTAAVPAAPLPNPPPLAAGLSGESQA
jgi:hypothetical protein